MKHNFPYTRLFVSLLFTLLIVQIVVLAQDAEPTSITLNDAITIVETDFPGDAIHELLLDTEKGCWSFELASGAEVCISVTDGTVVEDDDSIPTNVSGTSSDDEASEDDDEDEASDDVDDDDETYTIQAGDTLFSIAQANGITVEELQALNNLTDTTIFAGRELIVSTSDDDDDDDDNDLIIGVTLEEAIAEALRVYPDAIIISIELEEGYGGQGVWDIELDTGQEVDIALDDGQILGFGYTEDDEVEPGGGTTISSSTTSSSSDTSVDDNSDNDASEDANDSNDDDDASEDGDDDDDASEDGDDDDASEDD